MHDDHSLRIDRRTLVPLAAGVALWPRQLVIGQARSKPRTAAVLEFPDRWTKQSTGLARLLRGAGMRTRPLQLQRPATKQGVDLIAFGSFTNNDDRYHDYIEKFGDSIDEFVQQGGVVLEMTQSDQNGAEVAYLPEGLAARRGDTDLDRVFAIDPGHPVVSAWWPDDREALDASWFGMKHPNWESFEATKGCGVLLASKADGSMPCLVEAASGKGRYLFSSLYCDKAFDPRDKPILAREALERAQRLFRGVANYVDLVATGRAPDVQVTEAPPEAAVGPMVGHVDENSARIWFRPGSEHRDGVVWTCVATESGVATGDSEQRVQAEADPERDSTIVFDVTNLKPDREYRIGLEAKEAPAQTARFRTAPTAEDPAKVVIGMGSCAPSKPSHVWTRILEEDCEAFVFLGDTPYVDSSSLDVARRKHREFLSTPEIAEMIGTIPCWGTWDDHDFGKNDGHGDFPGKQATRRAFVDYRANASFGHRSDGRMQTSRDEGEGIYTSFRRGPIEVFLIDPRWFSRTESSFVDSDSPTCIGEVQWAWLRERLRKSTAPFKALATGMIWDDKENGEKDDWHTYRHERDALFEFISREKIGGCFLIGGDIHVSRALRYDDRVGYDLWQFITSPLHERTIPSLDVPHPALVHHALAPHTFLRLEVDSTVADPTLEARWIDRDGREIFQVDLKRSDLGPR